MGAALVGAIAWVGVVILGLLMAEWGQPVWGYFPILAAVLAAWAVGEYVSGRMSGGTHRD